MGIERVIIELEEAGYDFINKKDIAIYIATTEGKAKLLGTKLAYDLRKAGINVEQDIMNRALKAQFKYADKINANYSITIGDSEIEKNKVRLKNMKTSEEIEIELDIDDIIKNINK